MATRILVVNDTEELLEAFRDLLEDEGYEVTLFSYAPMELDDVRRAKPDLVILDLIFRQEKLGLELLQKMKLQPDLASLPVIVCSAAVNDIREMQGYLAAQGVLTILKPFDIDTLLDAVKDALKTRHNRVPPSEGNDVGDAINPRHNGASKKPQS